MSNIYLKVTGAQGTAKGTKAGFLEATAWRWGMKLPADPGTDVDTHGKPSIDELVITKLVDNATGDLVRFLTTGKVFKGCGEVMLVMTKNKDKKEIDFLTIKFTKCVIAGVQMRGGEASPGGDRLIEEVTLRFNAFEFEYQGDDEAAGTIDARYDIGENALA